MGKFVDLTGKKFGKLTVLERGGTSRTGQSMWKCICDCEEHNIKTVRGADLKTGKIQSCGCIRKANMAKLHESAKKQNRYEFLNDYVIGYDDKNNSFIIDLEDYEKIKDYYWGICNGYWRNTILNTHLHQFIMGKQEGYVTDHIDRDKNNNRKQNLRLILQRNNCKNRSLQPHNISGINGVTWYKQTNRWRVRITVNGKMIELGYFLEKEDAIKTRLEAELKYFGEYAPIKENEGDVIK